MSYLSSVTDNLGSASTYSTAGAVFGGFLVSEQGTARLLDFVGDQVEYDIRGAVPELSGVITAIVFYGISDVEALPGSEEMYTNMAIGSLVSSLDQFTDREQVKNLPQMLQGEA